MALLVALGIIVGELGYTGVAWLSESGTGSRVWDMGRHQDVALWLQHHPNHTLPSICSYGIKCKHKSIRWRVQVLHSVHNVEIANLASFY